MPDTGAPWELRYPAIGDAANVPEDMSQLATDVAAALTLAAEGPAPGAVLTGLFTPLSGWTLTGQASILIGWWLHFTLTFTRAGADITVPTTGDISNSNIATLAAAYTPLASASLCASSFGRGGFGAIAAGSGIVSLGSVAGSGAIVTGAALSLGGIVPVSY